MYLNVLNNFTYSSQYKRVIRIIIICEKKIIKLRED